MYKTFAEVKLALKEGATVESIVQHYLTEIENRKSLNAFLEVFTEDVLAQAKEVDAKIKAGTAGKLAGMVVGLKDNICYKDHKVSASSRILEGFESIYSATVVQRLLDEDAVIIGRLNCDEFAMGSSNETSYYGPVRNAINEEYVPGGSSGGSASALAAGLCTVTLGSDTGGSIRQPAAFTGTVGLKPTYGRVSRFGLIAYASSFDQIGPFTNNVEDAALVMNVISGEDEYDSTSSSKPVEDYTNISFEGKKKFAVIKDAIQMDGLDPEIRAAFNAQVEALKAEGHVVEEVSFPYLDVMVPTYYVITTAEASSNLSRFDGVHFGYRSEDAKGVEATYKQSRTEGFGAEVKRRIMSGTFVLSNEYYDSYYTKAQKVRRVIQDKTNEILANYDFIILPTTASTAFKLNSVTDQIQMYLQDIFTVQANLAGNPAISVPAGTHSNGLPFGIQIMADHYKEKELLACAEHLMKK
ncbi:aspartyl/glutamyl-tRNA(Asn/Gln) amidotransferase subunit A [Lishizhenia tianjinensis]|uniref:Glutamyl-tRNA(Gln) amidotransferase subunit A n=1 Tax=Lishizhenia tianjinensis TaxID=477690 RepID=A0A1I7BGG1_9FLAO|nr:Asp-tRNA(Asn)/Glu-tRNA(Gln) amidotransferase subunit GatA [Lishizhenia tianjinensis]SFT86275.1 aspartyl/glutamyl-tRNA(Asn/Gln) amidotransferase subunit A [Lishizhenia tianjinensis]